MAHPWVAEGICGLQIWRVVTNVSNESWTTKKAGPPAWGLSEWLTTSHCKIPDKVKGKVFPML
jgi:hypothetical protein